MQNLLDIEAIQLGYRVKNSLKVIVDSLSLSLGHAEIGCLLGPSGCGKTTALRAIAGFEPIYKGRISLDQQVISEPGRQLAPEQRHIGMMFQDYALFPHITIEQNIAFGLHKLPKAEVKRITDEMLDLIDLSALRKNYPHELSGGQQQRVALARAIAPAPKILLLDEPLDRKSVV